MVLVLVLLLVTVTDKFSYIIDPNTVTVLVAIVAAATIPATACQ